MECACYGRVAVVGAGYSAATTLRSILELAASREGIYAFDVHWLLRKKAQAGTPYAALDDDPLPSRAKLVELANALASHTPLDQVSGTAKGTPTPNVIVHRGCAIDGVQRAADGTLKLWGTREAAASDAPGKENGAAEAEAVTEAPSEAWELAVDTLVSQVGYRPSYELASEMRVHLCYESDGPIKLAASLKAARGGDAAAASDCMSQPVPGVDTLTTPEKNFFVLGSKSYGRDPAFLLSTGHKQVGAVVERLAEECLAPPLTEAAPAEVAAELVEAPAAEAPAENEAVASDVAAPASAAPAVAEAEAAA